MVVRDSSGRAFPGNATILPSGQKWVFNKICKVVFFAFFGPTIISRNRLAITDEDSSEITPYEDCLTTVQPYKKSMHMLCNFHAVMQPFQEEVYPKLPKKKSGKNSGKLTKKGETYGILLD